MISEGMTADFYISFLQFSDAYHTATNEIGCIRNASELESFKNTLRTRYGHGEGAGTFYSLGFQKAQEIIFRDLTGRTNQRVIVFMTDGIPSDTGGLTELRALRDSYGVTSFYAIAFELPRYSSAIDTRILQQQADIFTPNSEVMRATNSTLTNTFKNILYQINALEPETERSIDGKLELSDIEISAEKPLEITVKMYGATIKSIKIKEYPTSTDGVVFIQESIMYLNIQNLAKECGLEALNEAEVNISYFTNS